MGALGSLGQNLVFRNFALVLFNASDFSYFISFGYRVFRRNQSTIKKAYYPISQP